jgi:hypothetical protein
MVDKYGAFSALKNGRGNQSTLKTRAPKAPCPQQVLHNLTWDRTGAVVVGSLQLPYRAVARCKVGS